MSRKKPTGRKAVRRRSNQFRIIGGRWRGRRLHFPAVTGLRPTGDRVRETLFNWLAPVIDGARCLDLYAGSGALGLEALSRGAADCVFVDIEHQACEAISSHLKLLQAETGEVVPCSAQQYLRRAARPFDLVFLDPPFGDARLPELCTLLEAQDCLAAGARIYLECPAAAGTPRVPANWTVGRAGRAGNVGYFLCVRD